MTRQTIRSRWPRSPNSRSGIRYTWRGSFAGTSGRRSAITDGNVSLYNETDGKAIYPTPIIGVVGVIERAEQVQTRAFKAAYGVPPSRVRGGSGES